MATACCTSRWRGQKINACCISTLQGKLLPLDKEEDGHTRGHLFYFFSFIFFLFHLFTTNVTRALSLKTIKGEAGATSKRRNAGTNTHTSPRQPHTHHPSKETWDLLPLLKACNPYYEHSGARQHEQQ
jgi:hypothetical protein